MKISTIEIGLADDDKVNEYFIRYASGTWSIDGVVYPRYLKLMETISEFIRQEASMDKKFGKGEEK